jgi:phosphate/sulfate permease
MANHVLSYGPSLTRPDIKTTELATKIHVQAWPSDQMFASCKLSRCTRAQTAQIWADAEVFDEHVEEMFTYLQLFTGCLNSLAHGANDVANAIGPLCAARNIYYTSEYPDGGVRSTSEVLKWVRVYGGIGMVLGVALYGYKPIKSLGYKITFLSPSRATCALLASSLCVVTAAFLDISVSSTYSICGAVVGVGLVGGFNNENWLFFCRMRSGWAVVSFDAVVLSAGMFRLVELIFMLLAWNKSRSRHPLRRFGWSRTSALEKLLLLFRYLLRLLQRSKLVIRLS